MSEENTSGPLQFDHAETTAGPPTCAACNLTISDTYYDINGKVLCERCRYGVEASLNAGSAPGRFTRAALYGLGAGVLGSGIYYAVLAITNLEIGFIAILVGWLVGAAVRKGSQGRGGWAYQALAMFITYSSIVVTYLPFIFEEVQKQTAQEAKAPDAAAGTVSPASTESEPEEVTPGMFFLALAALFAIALAAPFLAGIQNIIGLLIIGIALYEAWKINRRVEIQISGPFQVKPA